MSFDILPRRRDNYPYGIEKQILHDTLVILERLFPRQWYQLVGHEQMGVWIFR